MNPITFTLALIISNICLCSSDGEFDIKYKPLMCYDCFTDPFDGANATCRTSMSGVKQCHGEECNVIKIEFLGEDIIYRTCDGSEKFKTISQSLFSTKDGSVQRYGIKVSWTTCYGGLCNSNNIEDIVHSGAVGFTAVWQCQVLALFASVVLHMNFYSNYF